MASSSPSPAASSSSPPQPSITSPPPTSSPPPNPRPAATSDPPASSSPPPSSSQPLTPPSTSPPPATPPPAASPPPPPPVINSPPLAIPSPPPPDPSSPPPSAPPPAPTLSPPPTPSTVQPPITSPPPPSVPLTPPPSPPVSFPPPSNPPPITSPPPSPATPNTPPPPSAVPPQSSPSPPQANPPIVSPPPPVPNSPPPAGSITPPLAPSTPPPKNRPPTVPSPPSPPPTNASSGAPSLPTPGAPPPLDHPADSSSNVDTPNSPGSNKSSSAGPNMTTGPGGGSPTGNGGFKTGAVVAVALVSALVVLSLVGLAVWFVKKRKKTGGGYAGGYVMPSPFASSQTSDSSYPRSPTAPLVHQSSGSHAFMQSPPEPGMGNSKWFSYEELSAITSGFSTQNLLGEGGFGCVYKGRLEDGREVAVKQLKVGGGQGEREFRAEVEIISRIHHRHLVSLVGYCISDNQRLLVYDYVPNNTLHYHLHRQERPFMDWATRVKVAAGAARGIAYLHEDCHPRIIHRDIKSSNILLDYNFEAQVSDFGLARLAMDACTHVTTRVMGTFGYLAPEYALSGKLTDKSDVYSFGVVLLELITGRKPVDDSQPLGDESLVEWARPLLSNALETRNFGDLPDHRLDNNYDASEMFRMIEAAAACVRHSAAMRPRMGQVLRALESLADIDLSNGIIPGQSELVNSAQQSAEIRLFRRMAFGSQGFSTDFSQTSWTSRRE